MIVPTTVEELFELYERNGSKNYGEFVTQTEHALQCAALAQRDGARRELVIAALFHDVGHLAVDVQDHVNFDLSKDDDDHEALGARILAPILGATVAQPVALHVVAKRWRCTRDPDYYEQLSPVECERFENHPGFREALWLRSWDEAAKQSDLELGELRDWEPLVNELAAAR